MERAGRGDALLVRMASEDHVYKVAVHPILDNTLMSAGSLVGYRRAAQSVDVSGKSTSTSWRPVRAAGRRPSYLSRVYRPISTRSRSMCLG